MIRELVVGYLLVGNAFFCEEGVERCDETTAIHAYTTEPTGLPQRCYQDAIHRVAEVREENFPSLRETVARNGSISTVRLTWRVACTRQPITTRGLQ